MSEGPAAGWELSLIDSAWHGSSYDGPEGLALAAELGYEAVDLFVGFHPGEHTPKERDWYLDGVRGCGLRYQTHRPQVRDGAGCRHQHLPVDVD